MIRYLGIDISLSSTAMVCLDEKSDKPVHIIKELGYSLHDDSTVEEQVNRARIISDGVVGFVNANPRKRTAIEGYSYGSKGSSVLQIAELGGIIRYRILNEKSKQDQKTEDEKHLNSPPLLRWELPHFVPPTSLKIFATGKGNTSKGDVAVGVYKKWQFDYPNDDNVIDAYVLAQMVKHCDPTHRNVSKMFQYQVDALGACGMLDPSDPLQKRL